MTTLTPALEAALAASRVRIFDAFEIQLPSYNLRLLAGSGEVTFGGMTFVAQDPTFGVLAMFESIDDGVDQEAPSLRLVINPPNETAVAMLSSPVYQGSRVKWWRGATNALTGAMIPDPVLLFWGEIDVPTLTFDQDDRKIEYDCVSAFELFFDNDEGVRLTNSYHQSVWPGELGLEFVVDVQQSLPWMSDLPRPVMIRDVTR